LVAIYNGTTGNVHKHMASMHPSLHLARKRQLFEPKQLILISISAYVSANNIRTFIKAMTPSLNAFTHLLHGWLSTARRRCCLPLMST
jgi:hypothetical protein